MPTEDDPAVDVESRRDKKERLVEAVKQALVGEGVEHGFVVVRQFDNGALRVVAGSGPVVDALFVPGGGGFGGGGASGTW